MIVSDYTLDVARRRAIADLKRYDAAMDEDGPGVLRVRIRVDGADALPPGKHLGASLFVMDSDPDGDIDDEDLRPPPSAVEAAARRTSSEGGGHVGGGGVGVVDPASAADLALGPEGDARLDQWREVENRHILPAVAQGFTSFNHAFEHGSPRHLRVEYFLVETGLLGGQTESDLGYAVATLQDVLNAPGGQLDVDLISMDHHGPVGRAAFGVEWVLEPDAQLAFEVRVRVNRREGWPFASSRVFFMVYRKEYDGQWKPLYLSEVRVKVTDHPDAHGCMLYAVAELNLLAATNGFDAGTIRIEFFQYKTSRSHHKLIGYVTTSLMQLRQSPADTDLRMQLNTFTNAELVGRAVLTRSRFTSRRSFFSLQADFGGAVEGNFLFLDFALAYAKGFFRPPRGAAARSLFASNRPYYELSRTNAVDRSRDEVLYRPRKVIKYSFLRTLKFPLAKVNVAKLSGGGATQPLCVSVRDGRAVRVAWLKTTLLELMSLPPGSVLPLTFSTGGSEGYVMLERRELTNNGASNILAYLSLRCVLGEGHCLSDSSGGSGALCEIPPSDADALPAASLSSSSTICQGRASTPTTPMAPGVARD
jgi:hypothetical protein